MVESILRNCGYRTGLFTSPHLWTVRERIQINGYVIVQPPLCWLFRWCWRVKQATSTKPAHTYTYLAHTAAMPCFRRGLALYLSQH